MYAPFARHHLYYDIGKRIYRVQATLSDLPNDIAGYRRAIQVDALKGHQSIAAAGKRDPTLTPARARVPRATPVCGRAPPAKNNAG